MIQEGIKVEDFPLLVKETGEEGRAESREGKKTRKAGGQYSMVDCGHGYQSPLSAVIAE